MTAISTTATDERPATMPDTDQDRRRPVPIFDAARALGITIREVYDRIDDGRLYAVRGDTEMLVYVDGNPPD